MNIKVSPVCIKPNNCYVSCEDLAFLGLKAPNLKDLGILKVLTSISYGKYQIWTFLGLKRQNCFFCALGDTHLNQSKNQKKELILKYIKTLTKFLIISLMRENLIRNKVNKDSCYIIVSVSIIENINSTRFRK